MKIVCYNVFAIRTTLFIKKISLKQVQQQENLCEANTAVSYQENYEIVEHIELSKE